MDVTRQVVLDADVGIVWELLTDERELSGWFGGPVRFDPRPGGAASFIEGPVVRHGIVDRVDPGRGLGFTWWTDGGPPSHVTLSLEEVDGGTRLTVTETIDGQASASASLAAGTAWASRLLGLELRLLGAPAVAPV